MNLPPLNYRAGQYQLPPVGQANPGQNMNQFFIDPATGDGASVSNVADLVQQYPQGNPLYYGQTSSYTGPQGPTDSPNGSRELPPVEEVQQQAQGMTFRDALTMMYGSELGKDHTQGNNPATYFANMVLNGPASVGLTNSDPEGFVNRVTGGLDLNAQYDGSNEAFQRLIGQMNQSPRSGGGDGGDGGR